MKTNLLIFALVVSGFAFSSCDKDDDKVISKSDLPETAQAFLNTYFAGITETRVEKDNDNYDVYLSNGMEVEFDLNGNWNDIDGNRNPLPATILDQLPVTISEYLTLNHENASVFSIDKEPYGYEVDMSNGWDVKFNFEGKFLSQTID
ncbi:MAG: PepSY-like domain-containing protein [Bacteroidales bacterium]|jgi:hypothetical protein|nr:PepSY-like domain-containing protein [Bacteroidales bacterium]